VRQETSASLHAAVRLRFPGDGAKKEIGDFVHSDVSNISTAVTASGAPVLERLDRRVPRWNEDSLIQRDCPFCDCPGQEVFVRPDRLTVRHCEECGAFFVSPCPDEKQLSAFYADYGQHHCRGNGLTDGDYGRRIRDLDPRKDVRICEIASEIDLRGADVLDVGCGRGEDLLCFSKLGAKVTGIDLDPNAVAFVRHELGVSRVYQCAIDELPGGVSYDVIMLHDVIEHPLAPMAMLEKARELLRPEGIMCIWTPNATGALEQESPTVFRVDLEHMQYLTVRTFAHIATALYLELVHLETVGFPSLNGMGNGADPLANRQAGYVKLKERFLRVPGVGFLNTVRKLFIADPADARQGDYHAHCLLRKEGGRSLSASWQP